MVEEKRVRLTAADGMTIEATVRIPSHPIGVITWLHGYASHGRRYAYFADWMSRQGFVAITPDLRGHGDSGGIRGHVYAFSDFFHDMDAILGWVAVNYPNLKFILGAHSHGALVASRYLEEVSEPPHPIEGAVLTGPFVGLGTPIPPYRVAIARFLSLLVPFCPVPTTVHPEAISRDPEVVQAYIDDPKVFRGAKARWFIEVVKAHREVKERASRILLPVLVMQGLADTIINEAAVEEFFERIGSPRKEWRAYEGLYHEILNEPEKEMIYEEMLRWIRRTLKLPAEKREEKLKETAAPLRKSAPGASGKKSSLKKGATEAKPKITLKKKSAVARKGGASKKSKKGSTGKGV